MLKIVNFSNIKNQDDVFKIFLETLDSKYHSEEYLPHYSKVYFNYYKKFKDLFLVAELDGKVAGYICASPSSENDQLLIDELSHFNLFKDEFSHYPAHLHINTASIFQGQGVGSVLVESLCERLRIRGINGLHLITSIDARNISFYLKNGFKKVREIGNLLMLGKEL